MPDGLVFESETVRISTERNVAVVCWRKEPRTKIELLEMERVGKRLGAQHKKGTALFNVIVSGTPSFTQEVRDEVNRITADDTLFDLASAHVLLVDGLIGSAVRAFLSTALLISRTKTPNKVFGTIEAAATWVQLKVEPGGAPWTRDELVEFVKRACAL